MVKNFLELTIVTVIVYLVLRNAQGFSVVARSFSQATGGYIRALQGR